MSPHLFTLSVWLAIGHFTKTHKQSAHMHVMAYA
jgi:hypothetical protein